MLIKITSWPILFSALAFLCCLGIASCDRPAKLEPLGDDALILAFGNSLTSGSGAKKHQAYPAQLESIVSRTVINAGVPGEISVNGLRRLPELLEQYQPDLIIICHGANDILRRQNLQRTQHNIQQMIELSQSQGAQVVLVGVPEFGIFLSSAEFYTELAEENRLPIENNVLSDVLKKTAYKSDQIHPNAEGYAIIAERLAELLKNSDAI